VTDYTGPEPDDPEILERLPERLRGNGFIAHGGGLHVRGACREPAWHSLREAWLSGNAFHRHYPAVRPDDVPFAEDAVGDQWLLRDGEVMQLEAETGEVESFGLDLDAFFAAVEADPTETLGLHPLLQLQEEGGRLEPGQLINVYPPFCMKEAADGVDLRPVPAHERHAFLRSLAAQLRDLPEGATIDFRIVD
jgi:hypothetical protein